MKPIHAFLGFMLAFPTMTNASDIRQVKICYIPFEYETSVPVTPSSIVEEPCKLADISSSTVKQLYAYLQEKPKTFSGRPDFDFLKVRLEVIDGEKPPYFVDQEGIVLISNERYQVDAKILKSMEQLLNGLFEISAK